jgi:hypothetical protein
MIVLNRLTPAIFLLAVFAIGTFGCSGASRSEGNVERMNVNEAMNRIQKQGVRMSPLRSLSPNVAQDGLLAETEYGDQIRIIEFQNASSASMQVSRKSSSAGSSPFFYQKGNIMVVHLGNDSRVANALETVFGPKKR